jgi:glycosyltransferase involved in cell wall biosynthesis
MEVLYVTKTSILSDGGGGEKRARKVTEGLANRGNDVTLLCGKTDRKLEKWSEIGGCDVRHVSCIPSFLFRFPRLSFYATRYLFAIASLPIITWLLIRDDFDVVVENMTPYPSLSVISAKLTGTSIVAVQHEFYDRSCYQTYDPATATIQLAVQNILRVLTYDRVIVPTTHVARQLAAYGVEDSRLVVIPNGVEAEEYQMSNIDKDQMMLITVGRLSKRKGQATILRAFQTIHEQKPETHLHLLGDGPARTELHNLASDLEITGAVTFHGYVDERQKIEMLNRAGLFVFASRQEGFGLVLLEAMSAGLGIVTTKLPVYEDFFEDGLNGRLLRSREASIFAENVVELLNNREYLSEIEMTNRQKAKEFSWTTTVSNTESTLEQCVDC